jgi:GT2 family glycosyltransferase
MANNSTLAQPIKVSILIGSRDRFDVLTRCLNSTLSQDYAPLEILVLDDNSSRYHLADLLAAQFQDTRLRCFRSDHSLGVAGGRNFLMQQAAGDIFCIIDDDAFFADTQAVVRFVKAFTDYPQVGLVATKVIDHRVGQERLLVPFSQRWCKKCPHLIQERSLVSYYLGGCHALRRQVVEQCGDYQYDLMFGEEELDLSYRAIEAGFEIMYLPEVVAHHYPQPSVVGTPGRQHRPELYYHTRNRFFLSYKYLPLRYIPVYLIIWLSVYGVKAVRLGALRDFLAGIGAGLQLVSTLRRAPLSSKSIQYLQTHYGRLWY